MSSLNWCLLGISGFVVVLYMSIAMGQESFASEDVSQTQNVNEGVRIPNLTVNFQLNSTLGPEETHYYAEVVEELLKNIPRRVELKGANQKLVRRKPVYDHLKVIAYLPDEGSDDPQDPTNKKVHVFNIDFQVPDGLQDLKDREGEGSSVVVHGGTYEDFMRTIRPADGEVVFGTEQIESAESGFGIDMFEKELKRIASSGGVSPVVTVGNEPVIKEKSNEVESLPPLPFALEDVTPSKPMPQNKNMALSNVPAMKPTKRGTYDIRLDYFGDNLVLLGDQKKQLAAWVNGVKKSGFKRINVIALTKAAPGKSASEVKQGRQLGILKILSSLGVDVNDLQVNEINLLTASRQYIELEATK